MRGSATIAIVAMVLPASAIDKTTMTRAQAEEHLDAALAAGVEAHPEVVADLERALQG